MSGSDWTKVFIALIVVLPVVWLLSYILRRITRRKGIDPASPWLIVLPIVGGLVGFLSYEFGSAWQIFASSLTVGFTWLILEAFIGKRI